MGLSCVGVSEPIRAQRRVMPPRYTLTNMVGALFVAVLVVVGLRSLASADTWSLALGGLSFDVLLIAALCLTFECSFDQTVVRCGCIFAWGLLTLALVLCLKIGDFVRVALALFGVACTIAACLAEPRPRQ